MLSYSRGPAHALWEKTVGQVLDQTVERWGDCLALVSRLMAGSGTAEAGPFPKSFMR